MSLDTIELILPLGRSFRGRKSAEFDLSRKTVDGRQRLELRVRGRKPNTLVHDEYFTFEDEEGAAITIAAEACAMILGSFGLSIDDEAAE